MKKIILLLAVILTGTLLYASEPEFPALSGPVVDKVNLLSPEQNKLLSEKLISFQKTKGSQIAVCIVPTTQPLTIEDYGIKLAENWKIGRAKIDDGIIIIVAKNDRKMRIEVGYGLESIITDLRSGRIVDQMMAPEFRKGDFYKGIDTSVDSLITFINGGDIPAISSSAGTSSAALNTDTPGFDIGAGLIIASIILFIVFIAMGKIFLSFLFTYITLCTGLYFLGVGLPAEVAIIGGFSMIPFVIIAVIMKYAPAGTSSGSSGYSSGYSSSSSYSSSSGSSSDSSYSGGGGDFGGGGSSGSW